ncbi:DUF3611 family protein [Synechocystis sp. PCC 7509]|uniref:DUF3611 family protein n=1 Tax=Synechocystis sp. PCC 7509 TaxID=927677 RepID=UPI0002AC838F|nr:DUF3611 family protein [Synechocystis sp. PCC 7509]
MNTSNKLNSYLPAPTKQKFAAIFRVVSRFSFWMQLALGGFSGIVLLLAIFSRNSATQATNPAIGLGIFLGIVGILLLAVRIYLAFRYRRLARRLQTPDVETHPKREDIVRVLQIGLIISAVGLLLAFLASETTVIALLARSLAIPQGVAVYRPENVIRSLDIFVVLANVNLIGAHLVGGTTSLGLLEWLD